MTGEWKLIDLTPDAINPEAHWLRTVMGADQSQRLSVRLSRKIAVDLFMSFSKQTAATVPATNADANGSQRRLIESLVARRSLRISQSSFAVLYWFLQENGEDTIAIELVVEADALDAIGQLSGTDGFEVTDVGPAPPAGAVEDTKLTIPDDGASLADTVFEDDCVIVAIIDDGIGIANHRFRLSANESRIAYFLDMDPRSNLDMQNPAAPDCDCVGKCWTKEKIDALFVRFGDDEEAIYRDMGMIDPRADRRQPLKFRRTHGTHMLDLAAGYDHGSSDKKIRETLKKRPIIAVQLPSTVVADRSDSEMAQALKCALEWIEVKARELSQRVAGKHKPKKYLPIVVNFSFGVIAGPHDGLGDVERRISDFIRRYRKLEGAPQCEVVLAAGNSLQTRAIARMETGAPNTSGEIPWRVLPDDKTSSFVQIWLPENTSSKQQIEVELIPPRDAPVKTVGSVLDRGLDWIIDATVFARIYHQKVARPDGEMRERITIAIRPTEPDGEKTPVCPSGPWHIRLTNLILPAGTKFDLRVQRDDPVAFERPKGRQSYFDDPGYVRFEPDSGRLRNDETLDEGPVLRRGTLSAYATGDDTVVAGGYRRTDGAPAIYSSAGPASSGRIGPTLAAVSDESPSYGGVLASGTYTGSIVSLNGTSVAAPVITRELADKIAMGKALADLLEEINTKEAGGIIGPHGPYVPDRPARHGFGRFVSRDAPAHRRRIEN